MTCASEATKLWKQKHPKQIIPSLVIERMMREQKASIIAEALDFYLEEILEKTREQHLEKNKIAYKIFLEAANAMGKRNKYYNHMDRIKKHYDREERTNA